MSYSLQTWEVLISSTLQPKNVSQFMETENAVPVLIELFEAEKDKLRIKLIDDFYSRADLKKMQFDIRFNQSILIKLLDKLYGYQRTIDLPEPVRLLYDTISKHVSFILDFIEEYFDKYLDRTEKVPTSYLDISRKEIIKSLEAVQKIFKVRKEIDEKLAGIIVKNFELFCEDKVTPFTYNDLIYQKELLSELLHLSNIPKDVDANIILKERLLELNFNDADFIQYFISGISEEIKTYRSPVQKTGALLKYQKQIRLVQLRPFAGLHPKVCSIKKTLLISLEKEVEYLRVGIQPELFPNAGTREFIQLPFKGSEIYLLHKSFIDSGGAPNEIYKSLLEKTASYLANKTTKGFSAESLVKYSDKVDPESKDNVRRFLQKMIRNVDSYD
jgi:hypothetical protein